MAIVNSAAMDMCTLSRFSGIWLLGTLWMGAHRVPQSMGFSRNECCSELPCSHPGYLPNPGMQPTFLLSPALAGGFFITSATWAASRSSVSRFRSIWLSVTLWTVTHQAPLSVRFSRQEYWTRLPWPPPGDLPNPGIKPASLTSPALAGGF